MRESISGREQVAERVRALLAGPDGVDAAPRVVRWQPSRRAVVALVVVLVVVGAVTLVWVLSARPQPLTVGAAPSPPGGPVATPLGGASGTSPSGTFAQSVTSATSAPSAGQVVIDVAGKVRRPGLYRVAPGSRIDDAIKAAGGALPGVDLISLNLAAKVSDGQQILVGVAAPTPPVSVASAGAAGPAATAGSGALVNLNTADLTTLQSLPGVGPVTAQHILEWRTQHGQFSSVDQLQDVSGIGPVKFAAMKDQATV